MKGLQNFSQININTPVDAIIKQIRDLISQGHLNPGDRLPAERVLSERLGVSRSHLREAIRKMEFYGILRTLPQKGTIVAGLGLKALQVLITDMLNLQGSDFTSLVETRIILETNIVQLASEFRTEEDLDRIHKAMEAHREKLLSNRDAVEEDFVFHLEIAEASKNTVLKSLMSIITPDIVSYFRRHNVCGEAEAIEVVRQHEQLLHCIAKRDAHGAALALETHLKPINNYSQGLRGQGFTLNGR